LLNESPQWKRTTQAATEAPALNQQIVDLLNVGDFGPGGRRFKSSLTDQLFSVRYTPSSIPESSRRRLNCDSVDLAGFLLKLPVGISTGIYNPKNLAKLLIRDSCGHFRNTCLEKLPIPISNIMPASVLASYDVVETCDEAIEGRRNLSSADRKPLILVAGDEVLIRGTIVAILQNEGYEAVGVKDGIDALQALRVSVLTSSWLTLLCLE
jgi:CheY-like chemotaxis protein